MATDLVKPKVIMPKGFDPRWEAEMALKGHLSGVTVRLGDGSSFRVSFLDPVRLGQDLALEAEGGTPYIAEPGLIVVPEVTMDAIHEAVEGAWRDGFFDSIRASDIAGRPGSGANGPVG